MNKKILVLSMFLAAGCATQYDYVEGGEDDLAGSFKVCPKVEIKQADKAIIQTASGQDLFKIEAVGYTGNCYYDKRVLKEKAVVFPQFKITRLTNNHVEDIHFSYYLETVEGPSRFLGKKTYFAKANMIVGVNEIIYTAKPGELSIPASGYDIDMYLGLNAWTEELEYKVK